MITNNFIENKSFPSTKWTFENKKVSVRESTNCFSESELSALSNLDFYARELSKHNRNAKGSLKRKLESYENLVNVFFNRSEMVV